MSRNILTALNDELNRPLSLEEQQWDDAFDTFMESYVETCAYCGTHEDPNVICAKCMTLITF